MAAFISVLNIRNRKTPIDVESIESRLFTLPEISETVIDEELGMLMLNGCA
jgi:hypothetical protein